MIDYALIVAVIMGITEIAKKQFGAKYMPVFAFALGIVAGVVYLEGDIASRVFFGMAIGLTSSGLFDLAKIPKK